MNFTINGLQRHSVAGELHHVRRKTPCRAADSGIETASAQVGRLFPALPNHMRLTIGRKKRWKYFLTNFREVVA